MKLCFHVVVFTLLALSTQAATVQGDIPLSILDTNETVQTKQCGDGAKAIWSCRVGEFYGWETIFAHGHITNTGSKRMWGQCSLAFYDSDKSLVGTVMQAFIARRGLKPGARKEEFAVCRKGTERNRARPV
jgi:hypothetical protein